MPAHLSKPGVVCALGNDLDTVRRGLLAGDTGGVISQHGWVPDKAVMLGVAARPWLELPPDTLSHERSRNNQLLHAAAAQIAAPIRDALERFGADRLAVILGTSTSGVNDCVPAFAYREETGDFPPDYDYRRQELCSPATFLARHLGITGPVYTVSTACTSGARALLSASRLLRMNLCDAVVCGGVDALCRLTINGFDSLQALSPGLCNPFSARRDGINIGEGAAVFLMTREPDAQSDVVLLGGGASSDAWHMSAPHPEGAGAIHAMRAALADAALTPGQIGWINLHGTATEQNDAMESRAVHTVIGDQVLCTSTKPLTGHTLGAAGALEAAFCWMAASRSNAAGDLPPHRWDGRRDAELPPIALTGPGAAWAPDRARIALSNSFAFGGNNACVILGSRT